MNLTPAQFTMLFPKASAALLDPLNRAMTRFDITSPVRTCAFLAQIGHESAGLTVFVENLNYDAVGLARTWSAFRNPNGTPNERAFLLSRKPQQIASFIYAGKNGNGNEASNDGWTYRGRGAIQITGRSNYRAAAAACGLPLIDQPDLAAQPDGATLTAAWYWGTHGCNELADGGRFTQITQVINGGQNGADDRRARWTKAKEVLCG